LTRFAQVDSLLDGAAKPLVIDRVIGRRPVIAFGNADGDMPMREWTSAGDGPRFGASASHRRRTGIGVRPHGEKRQARQGLDEAGVKVWLVVDMKDDWKMVFKPDSAAIAVAPSN